MSHYQRYSYIVLICLLNTFLCFSALQEYAHASSIPPLKLAHARNNLEAEKANWGIFHDMGYVTGRVDFVKGPNFSSTLTTLKLSLTGGNPFTGIQAYHDIPAQDKATTFEFDVYFLFPQLNGVQALEFAMSKWVHNMRWEWAMQWEAIGDINGRLENPPTWRVWNGTQWKNAGIHQVLKPQTWHHLRFSGDTLHGQVHYLNITCDTISGNIASHAFAPVASPGEKLAVSMQLDGDLHNTPYLAYYNRVSLKWQ